MLVVVALFELHIEFAQSLKDKRMVLRRLKDRLKAAIDEAFAMGACEAVRKVIVTPDKENGFYTARVNLDLRSDDADHPALELANFIFGDGGLKSRLMDRIRQKDGLSYGGGTGLQAGEIDRAGSFEVSAIAAPQNLKKLQAAIREAAARA